MNEQWPRLISLLAADSPNLDQVKQAGREFQQQLQADPQQPLEDLFEHLAKQQPPVSQHQELAWEQLLNILLQHLPQPHTWKPAYLHSILKLYQLLGTNSNVRYQLLHLCTQVGDSACLTAVAEQLATDPPQSSTTVGVIFAPLFQDRNIPYDNLFPRLLDTLEHPSVAATTLDLTNYLVRKEYFTQHPASDWLETLQT